MFTEITNHKCTDRIQVVKWIVSPNQSIEECLL